MPSPFSSLMDIADKTISDVMGELAEIRPRTAMRRLSASLVDPDRPPVTVRAVLSQSPDISPLDGLRQGGQQVSGVTHHMGAQTCLWMPAAARALIGYEVRRGDQIALVERADEPVFAVSVVELNDQEDLKLLLVREDTP